MVPTPGLSPGHISVVLSSRGETAIITGDLMHHPIQCAIPELASNFDYDVEQAQKTRMDFLANHADKPILVLDTHFCDADCRIYRQIRRQQLSVLWRSAPKPLIFDDCPSRSVADAMLFGLAA